MILAISNHELGNKEKSNEILNSLIKDNADEWANYIAKVYAWRHNYDSAFEWLSPSIR